MSPPRITLSAAELATIAQMRRTEGLSWTEVEERTGYCRPVLWRNFRENGFETAPGPMPPGRYRWSDQREMQFLALIAGGVGVIEAGRRVGVRKNQAIGKWHRLQAAKARHNNEIGRS